MNDDAVETLAAGVLVTPGSLTEPHPVGAGDRVAAAFASLGEAELRVR